MNSNQQQPKTLAEAVELFCKKILGEKWTISAGIVDSYDHATRRAKVQPTPRDEDHNGVAVDHPLCLDVPVIFPAGGGYTITMPLERGDPVVLAFSRRGLTQFKKTFTNSDPSGGIMQMDAAIAIAGFGAMSITPSTGISLQKNDGSVKVDVKDAEIEIKCNDTVITVDDLKVDISIGLLGGALFNADGSVLFKNGASILADGTFVSKPASISGGFISGLTGFTFDTHAHNPPPYPPLIPVQ